ncbi:protein kinase [Streptomyces sp. NPDC001744]|uniref:protein kinase n=1 Tax=Streptomyces sp. NPDC001744 TaxID=3364606 RepID=UPI00367C917D
MDDYAGRVLADRYRLPLPPEDAVAAGDDLTETYAFDTYSGQEVLVRRVPLPEFVDAEVLDGDDGPADPRDGAGRATRRPAEPVVRRAIEAAQAAAQIPDHPLLDQVFDVFAEAGSLWIVSERVAARPLAALLAERPLNPYRAAEIGADVLTALRALHAHGWVHRNITSRTVLVCDDGRVMLTGLAVGAAEEALCGYAPVPAPEPDDAYGFGRPSSPEGTEGYGPETEYGAETAGPETYGPETYGPEAYEEPHGPEAHGPSGGYEPEEHASGRYAYADEYGATVYVPKEYDSEEYHPDVHASGAYGSGPRRPEAYEAVPYGPDGDDRPGADPDGGAATGAWHEPARAPETGAGAVGAGTRSGTGTHPGGDDHAGTGTDPEADPEDASHGAAHDDSPEPPAPDAYGADPYGRATAPPAGARPAATPPTADVRAARAGAIAAYRAGARAAARMGETGALPVQRPASPEPPAPPPPPTAQAVGAPEPQWWSRVADDDDGDDDGDGDEPYGGGPRTGPPRVMLTGSWSDGPHSARDGSGPIPAGGGSGRGPVLPGSGRPALPAGYTAVPGTERLPVAAGVPEARREPVPAEVHRGPATRLAAERARQTRIAVVGAVTERWAPEQAGPVHENWRLAPPIGPATDLWALGALLYRAVQGHAPYPEDSAAELVQLVCAEPPAFAEECGPLRPVVESLLRQDPDERPDFEELRGWLRSLVRSAPEPDAGFGVVPLPSDGARLPIVRRRGELVRRWRKGGKADKRGKGAEGEGAGRRRHKRGRDPHAVTRHEDTRAQDHGAVRQHAHAPEYAPAPEYTSGSESYAPEPYAPEYAPAPPPEPYASARETGHAREAGHPRVRDDFREEFDEGYHEELPQRAPRAPRPPRAPRTPVGASGSPRSLGCMLLALVLLLLAGVVAYAVLFMSRGGSAPEPGTPTTRPDPGTAAPPTGGAGTGGPTASGPSPSTGRTGAPATTPPPGNPSAPAPAAGYTLRQDPEGFRIGVPNGWRRSPINDAGQVRYTGGDFTMIVVPGRDSVRDNGSDPLVYQNAKERELEPWRASSWSGAERTRRIDVGSTATATGSYWWLDGTGREVFVRNLVLIDGGRYHVVQVIGPYTERDKVSEIHDEATKAFRPGR